jgi:hypothetical protein
VTTPLSPEMQMIVRLCGVLIANGTMTLAEVQEVLGEWGPTDAELVEHRPPGMSLEQAIENITKVNRREGRER